MKLLAFSGRRQSGKDSCVRFIEMNAYHLLGMIEKRVFGSSGVSYMAPRTCKHYLAEGMKNFAVDYLGIDHKLVWGTNEDKNKLTSLRWEMLPHYKKIEERVRKQVFDELYANGFGKLSISENERVVQERLPQGFMTVREVLQQIGEEMFLDLMPDIWLRRFKEHIEEDKNHFDMGLCADPRKPEQIDCIHELGGKVIRLTRTPFPDDQHISERALDRDRFDWNKFDAVIDNEKLTIEETNRQVYEVLLSWGWLNPNPQHVRWVV